MTVIKFHGLLAKKFGSEIKLHLGNLKFLNSAIDSVRPGFINFLKEKEKNFQFYQVSKKSDQKIIEIFPSTLGSGFIASFFVGFIAFLLTSKWMVVFGLVYFTGLYKNPTFWKVIGYTLQVIGTILMFTPFAPLGFLLSIMGGIAVGYGNYLEAMQKIEKMKNNYRSQDASFGGDANIIAANGKSYIFNRTINLATQGSAVQIVYGKLKIGSKLIAINLKSTESSLVFDGEPWNSNEAIQIYG